MDRVGLLRPGPHLHKAAKQIAGEFDGVFPGSVESLESLPGIGRSTAGAIAALAMNISAPILDGNVKRVLTRYLARRRLARANRHQEAAVGYRRSADARDARGGLHPGDDGSGCHSVHPQPPGLRLLPITGQLPRPWARTY